MIWFFLFIVLRCFFVFFWITYRPQVFAQRLDMIAVHHRFVCQLEPKSYNRSIVLIRPKPFRWYWVSWPMPHYRTDHFPRKILYNKRFDRWIVQLVAAATIQLLLSGWLLLRWYYLAVRPALIGWFNQSIILSLIIFGSISVFDFVFFFKWILSSFWLCVVDSVSV